MNDNHRALFAHVPKAMNTWYSWLGVLVAGIAITNFMFSVTQLPLSTVVATLLKTYQAIVHGSIDWALYLFGWKLPGWIKDLIFIYFIIGGAFMRARQAEGIYSTHDTSFLYAFKGLYSRHNRDGSTSIQGAGLSVMYQRSPIWLKRAMDLLLWPRVARQYIKIPMVYFHEYSGTYQTFKANYTPGPRKVFLHDRRKLFFVHLFSAALVMIFIVIINGFLTIPIE
ncbi:hypothetical protein [Bosea sp. RAC05]|uniref:hypothetical protein n=1 Tax=Bosea sp. RAC05 TaxID=1842539 RepID=UPI0012371387|nr:hypothetical protein [Bosea sp. RAC05]